MKKAENCRRWRESLGAYALGHLPAEERAAVKAHLDGCADCRNELAELTPLSSLLPLANPDRFVDVPAPPAELAERIMAVIGAEKKATRRRRLQIGVALSGATAAVVAAVLAIFVLPGDGGAGPEQHVAFRSLPAGMKIGATLEPHTFGTEIHMYVKGVRSGTLCRVYLRRRNGTVLSAGSFRYRWDEDDHAVLSSALDLSKTAALVLRVGNRTFAAPVGPTRSATDSSGRSEEKT